MAHNTMVRRLCQRWHHHHHCNEGSDKAQHYRAARRTVIEANRVSGAHYDRGSHGLRGHAQPQSTHTAMATSILVARHLSCQHIWARIRLATTTVRVGRTGELAECPR